MKQLNYMLAILATIILASCGNKKYVECEYFQTGSTITVYPAAYGGEYLVFDQDDTGMGCTVYNRQKQQLVYGGRIIFLTSLADKKYYLIALNDDKTAVAYDDTGKELFHLDRQKMKEFPLPVWSDISVEFVTIPNELSAFKEK